MLLSDDLKKAAALRQMLAETEGRIKRETATINKSAAPWDPSANREQFAAAQARCDSVAATFGSAAPPPMAGEDVLDYRVRLAAPYTRFAKDTKLRDVDLGQLAASSPAAFTNLETMIYNDAVAYAASPASLPQYSLREVVKADQSGRKIHEFIGDPSVWLSNFASPPNKVRRFLTPNWREDVLSQAARFVR